MIYKYIPSTSPESAHTLLLLHGTGGNESDLLPLSGDFGPGFNYLSLRGNVMENGMPRFFKRLGMGIFDEDDIYFRTEEMYNALKDISIKENFNPDKIIALGYSNGANIAGAMLMIYPGFLKGAVLWRAMQPLNKRVPQFSVTEPIPILFTSGNYDNTVRKPDTEAYISLMQSAGYGCDSHFLETGHNLTASDIKLTQQFLSRF